MRRLDDALNGHNWIDGSHLDPRRGDRLFFDVQFATGSLYDLSRRRGSSIPPATLQPLIQQLVAISRLLAVQEIADATAAHGNARDLASAARELARGDASGQRPDSAIDHYGNAWDNAEDSLHRR